MPNLFIDADNCPLYPEVIRAAQRHALEVYVVTRDFLCVDDNVHLILAQDDGVGGSEWIAANISYGDICVTGERALAVSCLMQAAVALEPTGRPWSVDAVTAGLVGAMGGVSLKPSKPAQAWAEDTRTFARRLDTAITKTRAAKARPAFSPSSPISIDFARAAL